MKRSLSWLFVGAFSLGLSQLVAADLLGVHRTSDSSRYMEKACGMIGRGALNLTTGFVDLLTRTINETKLGPPVLGTLRGLAYGAGCGLLRTGSGAVDLVTFWVPGFHGAPVSSSYDNCLVDEYQMPE